MTRNVKAIVEYDGTDYKGWQRQDNGPSVQAEVERAIQHITRTETTVRVAGRTDAGVHARGQVFNFRTESTLSTYKLAAGLNAVLPKSISIHDMFDVPESFDSKRDSLWKRYRYSIYQAPQRAAHDARFAWHKTPPLDLNAMKAASEHLLGEQDFESFRAVGCQAEHAIRHMMRIDIEQHVRAPSGVLVTITYQANAFVQHMCRILSGTLVEVGLGKRSPQSVHHTLLARDRKQAGMTAPPHGLCLLEVRYPETTPA